MSTEDPPFSAAATTTMTSLLDKPLHQLSEDDISQLTREDCRRYLKQKGMRRPSWNKSQAIQQVIMLKALLEPEPKSGDGGRKLYITPQQQQIPATRVQKGTCVDTEISLSAEESALDQRNDVKKPDFPGDNDSVPPRVTDDAKGQMTIFYSGRVNVYDDVPVDKAQALLQLAASPLQFPQEALSDGTAKMHPLTSHLQAPSIEVGSDSSGMLLPTLPTVRMPDHYKLHREESNIFHQENSGEGSGSRKASVQRYLEKRKDRLRSKRKAVGSFDVYLSHHQTGNEV